MQPKNSVNPEAKCNRTIHTAENVIAMS